MKSAYVLIDNTGSTPDKVDTDTKVNPVAYNNISGEITLKLSSGQNMIPRLSKNATRNFNIVKASNIKTTYSINKPYTSGTQFRIYIKSKQRGFVYLIGYGGYDKSVNKLYPFDKYSTFFNYTNSEIAIPNEDYFIEFDNKPGKDILCVLYSKEELNINDIVNRANSGSGDFVANIKSALKSKMFNGDDVTFKNDKIQFNASSKSPLAKVVPIFISVNHQ